MTQAPDIESHSEYCLGHRREFNAKMEGWFSPVEMLVQELLYFLLKRQYLAQSFLVGMRTLFAPASQDAAKLKLKHIEALK